MNWIIDTLLILFTAFDVWFTRRRVLKYSIEVELNTLAKSAMRYFGITQGLCLTVLLPWIVVIVLCHGYVTLSAGLLGFRGCLIMFQLLSLKIERIISGPR